MTPDEFTRAAAEFGVAIDATARDRFERYHLAIERGNRRGNLTRITARPEVYAKHFVDSLSCLPVLDAVRPSARPGERGLIDVGSGPGLPGVAVAIVRPDWRVVLLESSERKVVFLRELAVELGLANVSVVSGRAEVVGRDPGHRERYDVAVARAVAKACVLAEYLLPFVAVGGVALMMKGTDPAEEVRAAVFGEFGGRLESVRNVRVPGVDADRHLVVVEKTAAISTRFPRRDGVPAKRPIATTNE